MSFCFWFRYYWCSTNVVLGGHQGKYPWMLPMFGGFVGFFSDWMALQMMFRPLPKEDFGLHGKVCSSSVKMKSRQIMQRSFLNNYSHPVI